MSPVNQDLPVNPTFRLHDSKTHLDLFFFSEPMLVPIDVPDSSTDAAPNGDVARRSLGTDMPMSMADAASFLLTDCDLLGMGMGIEEEVALELDICVLKIGLEVDVGDTKPDDDDVEDGEFSVFSAQLANICSPMLLNWFDVVNGISLFVF